MGILKSRSLSLVHFRNYICNGGFVNATGIFSARTPSGAAALLIFLLLAAVMLVLAVRAVRAPAAVPADAASLVAGTDGTHLTISQNGEVILTTAIDVRTLPSADREALRRGITLRSDTELTQLLEDYS